MIKISSSTTFVMKRVFPLFWFGFIGIFLLANLLGGLWRKAPAFLLIPLVLAGFGFFLLKILVWDLVDEVYDYGDHLLIRNAGEEDSVRLADIINVNSSFFVNPPRITLRLATACKFGTDVAFSPPRKLFWNPFAGSPIADDLITRANLARRPPLL